MKGYHESKTPEPQRDLWQTPPYVFKYYDARFNFSHDVAATASNALANCYYTEDDDALTKQWGADNWCNPPYSDTSAWVDKAIEQTSDGSSRKVVMLLPAATSVAWFAKAMAHCSECHLITGRIAFINSETGLPVKNNNIGSVVFVFDGESPVKQHLVMIHRDEMKG